MINLERLRREHRLFLNDHQTMVEAVLTEAGLEGIREVESNNVGFKAAATASGIRKSTKAILHRTSRGHVLKLRNTARHANAQDGGSGLYGPRAAKYTITARRRKTLAFIGRDGTMVFRRTVQHPGVKPTHFLLKATTKVAEAAGEKLLRGMSRVASRH